MIHSWPREAFVQVYDQSDRRSLRHTVLSLYPKQPADHRICRHAGRFRGYIRDERSERRERLVLARSANYELLRVHECTYLEDFVRSSEADPREETDGLPADAFRGRVTEDGEV